MVFNLTEEEISALPRIRTEIMSGNGPDLYTLPSENTQLLKDVYLAADAGVFADITAKAAQSENFAQCNKEVMKAGQYNGKQFLYDLCDIEQAQEKILKELQKVMAD